MPTNRGFTLDSLNKLHLGGGKMAKVTGPLMSMDASGKFGGTLVFSKWKGRNVVRQLVIPANPNSQGQEDARNRTRVTGALQAWVNATGMKAPLATETDKVRIKAVTPGGYAWNGFLTQTVIGQGGLTYNAAQAAYTLLTAPQKAAWVEATNAVTPLISDVFQTVEGGGAGVPITDGEVFFILQYGLSLLGLADLPGAVPPVYA